MSVKLLLDQNLSPKLVKRLDDIYPNSGHLDPLGFGEAQDILVWQYAKDNDFVIVTKDADFAELSLFYGFPPNVVWIRRGNCSTSDIEDLLRHNRSRIYELSTDDASGILTIF